MAQAKKPADERIIVMVALRLPEPARLSEGGAAVGRGKQYAAMRAAARAQRNAVVEWLVEQGLRDQVKKVSEVTAFGTFTLECSAGVCESLGNAPNVESVTKVGDLPLKLIDAHR